MVNLPPFSRCNFAKMPIRVEFFAKTYSDARCDMIRFYKNADGGRVQAAENFSEGCWVDMVNPTDGECEQIISLTGVGEDMLKAALDEEERARAEFDDGCSMYIIDCPVIEEGAGGDGYTTLPLAIIYNGKCIITVSLNGNTVLNDFITGREKIYCDKPVHFALTFMLCNSTRFLYCLKQIDRKNHRIQAEMERTMRNEEIIQLLDLQNALVYFSTSLSANDRVHVKLSRAEAVARQEELTDLSEDVQIETRQAIETCEVYKNILSVTMDAYGSVISNNSNNSMRTLTVITILLAVPTMIAGFWGMNMPVPFQSGIEFFETGWFWLVILGALMLTGAIAVFMLKAPRRTGGRKKHRNKKRDKK